MLATVIRSRFADLSPTRTARSHSAMPAELDACSLDELFGDDPK